jgi:hypothetical protein
MKLHHARFLFTELQRPIGFDAPHDVLTTTKYGISINEF